MTVTIVNRDGDRVRRLADWHRRAARGRRCTWSGTAARTTGCAPPTGSTGCRSGCAAPAARSIVPGSFNVDTTAPKPVVLSVTPPIAGPGAGRVRDPRPRRRAPPRADASASCAPTSAPVARGRPLPGPRGQPPRRLGRAASAARRRRRAPTWSSWRCATAPATSARRPPCSRRCRARCAASRGSPCARSPRSRRSSRCAPASASSSSSTRAGARTAGASAASGIARPIKRGTRGAGAHARRARPAAESGAYLLQVRSGRYSAQRAVPRPGARAGAAARRGARHHVARRRPGRRRRRRPAQHARDRRPGEVAARDRRRPRAARRPSPTRPRRCSSSSTARASATTSPPTSRSPAPATRAPPTARAWSSPARCAGSRARWRGGCGATSRTAAGWRASAPTACGAGCASAPNRLTRPTQPTPIDPFGARLEPVRRPRAGEDGRRRCR